MSIKQQLDFLIEQAIRPETRSFFDAGIKNFVPAFKDLETGEIYLTGAFHDENRLPQSIFDRIANGAKYIDIIDDGFWNTKEKKYYTRAELSELLKNVEQPKLTSQSTKRVRKQMDVNKKAGEKQTSNLHTKI